MSTIENAPDLSLTPDFLSAADVARLFANLCARIQWDERMKARKTACFGQTYDDSGVDYPLVPMHPLLAPLCESVGGKLGFRPTNCLLNYYETGRSRMGFHADAVWNLAEGTGVAILSLGTERSLTFRSIADPSRQVSYALPAASLLYMSQLTQQHWTHAIKPSPTVQPRISLTFRQILTPEELRSRNPHR